MRSSVFLRILTSTNSSSLIQDISPATKQHRNKAIRSGVRNSLDIYRNVANKCHLIGLHGKELAAGKAFFARSLSASMQS